MLFLFKLISGEGIESPSVVEEFVEWEEYEKGFNKHYQKYLKGPIEKFERNRIKALVTARRRLFISIPIIFVLFLFLVSVLDDVNSKNEFPFRSLLAAVAFLTFDYFLIKEPILKYWDDVKTEIFPHILSFLGNFTYSVEMEDFYRDHYESYDIVPQHDCSYFEDLIVGEYNGVKITLFESVLENRRYKKQRSYIVFEGVVLKLSINKKFHGKTIIRRDLGGLDNWITDKLSDLDVVNLEDPEFEKQFEVFSTDQIESRYLLTPSFMQRLIDLNDVYESQKMECAFYDNSLLMLISLNRNLFEPGSIFSREDFIDDAKILLRQMNAIFSIIETLKLDLDIGL